MITPKYHIKTPPPKKEIDEWNSEKYFERMERLSVSLHNEFYGIVDEITLWWGEDGLKMNKNGHCEWVKKWKEEKTEGEIAYNYYLNEQLICDRR